MKRRVAVLLMAAVFCFSSLDLSAASGQQPEKAGEETSADQEDGEEVPVSGQETGEEDSKEDLSETGTDLEEAAGQTDPASGQEGAKPETDGTSDENRPEGDGTGQEPGSTAGDLKPGDEEGAGPDGNEVTEETGKEGEETGQEPDGASQDTETAEEENSPEESTEPEERTEQEPEEEKTDSEEDAGVMPIAVKDEMVARIGDKKYQTLDAAMAEAKDGDVIVIIGVDDSYDHEVDCNKDDKPYDVGNRSITIDGSEYLAAKGEIPNLLSHYDDYNHDIKYMFSVNGGSLTLKNVKVSGGYSGLDTGFCEVRSGKLVLQGSWASSFARGRSEPVHICAGGTMEVDAESYCGISYFHGYYPKTDEQLEEDGYGYDYNYIHSVKLESGASLINRGGHIAEVFAESGAEMIMEGGIADRVYLEYDETAKAGGTLQLKSGNVKDLAVSTTEKGTSEKLFLPDPGTYIGGGEIPEQKIQCLSPAAREPVIETDITEFASEEDRKYAELLESCAIDCGDAARFALDAFMDRDRSALQEAAAEAMKRAFPQYTDDIYLHIQPYTQVKIKQVDAAKNIITLDISMRYDLVASTTDAADQLDASNSISFETGNEIQPTESILMSLFLPKSFAAESLTVRHTKDSGEVYYYSPTYIDDDANADRIRVSYRNRHGFSEFQFLLDEREAVIEYGLTSGTKRQVTYKPGNINAAELLSDDRNGGTFEGWVYDGIDGVWKGLLTDDLLSKLSERYAQTGAPVRATPKYASGGSSGNHSSGSSSGGHSSGGSSSAGAPAPASAVQPISSAATGDDTDPGTPLLLLMLALAGLSGCWKLRKSIG